MNLLCRIEHLHGQHLLVEGQQYFIGDNGICTDVPAHHAEILLAQPANWSSVHSDDYTRVQDVPGDPTDDRQQPPGTEHLILPEGEDLMLRKNMAERLVHIPGRRGGTKGMPKKRKT